MKNKSEIFLKNYSKYIVFFGLFIITIFFSNIKIFYYPNLLSNISTLLEFYFFFLIIVFMFFHFYFNRKDLSKENENKENILNKYVRLEDNYFFDFLTKNIYIILIFIIFFIGFIIRIYNLLALDPYTDEYLHLYAGKEFLDSGFFQYKRAEVVTYFTALYYYIGSASSFYEYLYWGRIPSVIFSSLTVFPLYFLGKKISKNIGILSAILWIFSPWSIGVGKAIREYAFYPFFILFLLLILIELIKLIFNYKKKNNLKIFIYSSLIFSFFWYAFFIDFFSTLKISAIIVLCTCFYFFMINYKKIKIYYLLTLIFASVSTVEIIYIYNSHHISFEKINLFWLNFFFTPNGTPMHWWNGFSFSFLVILLILSGVFYSFFKKEKYYFLFLLILSAIFIFFIFFFNRYVRERYIFYALPFFVILISVSLKSLFSILSSIKNPFFKIISIIFFLVFLSQTFNYKNTIYPMVSNNHGYVGTTNEYHDKIGNVLLFLEDKIKEEDIIITTLPPAIRMVFGQNKIFYYDYTSDDRIENTNKIIEDNSQGFMILDWRRNVRWAKGYSITESFYVSNKEVKLIFAKDNFYIYRWKP